MEPAGTIAARPQARKPQHVRTMRRKLRLDLFELEVESGEDEALGIELPLDQLES